MERAVSGFIRYQFHRGEEVEAEEMLLMCQTGMDVSQAMFTPHHSSLLTGRSRTRVVTSLCCNHHVDMGRLGDISCLWR